MAENTKIEWAHHTFNPWWGCAKISAGCDHCYAETLAKRTGRQQYFGGAARMKTKGPWKDLVRWDKSAGDRGVRERVFVGSMCDIGEANLEIEDLQREALEVLAQVEHLDVLLLTKRPAHLAMLLDDNFAHGLPGHFWVGCTVENQQMADERIPHLLQIPAAVRFVSVEPMLGPVDLRLWLDRPALAWVICGGESGGKARPMHPDWVRSLRDQCVTGDTPYFFKQWGEWAPIRRMDYATHGISLCGKVARSGDLMCGNVCGDEWDGWGMIRRYGKKAAGRMLDGREHLAFPGGQA